MRYYDQIGAELLTPAGCCRLVLAGLDADELHGWRQRLVDAFVCHLGCLHPSDAFLIEAHQLHAESLNVGAFVEVGLRALLDTTDTVDYRDADGSKATDGITATTPGDTP